MNAPIENPTTNPRLSQANIAVPARPAAPAGPAAPVQQPPAGAPDVGALIRRLFAHWHVVIVTLVLGGIITAQVVRTRKPAFKSETVIFYREGIGRTVTGTGDAIDMRGLGTKLKETLLAQQNLRRIIDEFHLYPEIVSHAGYADAVDLMRKKTDFKSRSQDTFAISFEGTTREDAQRVCARMADLLVAENAKRMAEDNRSTTEFLEVEKKRADEELERMEREISEFLHAHPEFAGAKEGLGTESAAQRKKVDAEMKRRRAAASKAGRSGPKRDRDPAPAGAAPAPAHAAAAIDPVLLQARTQAIAELAAARKDLADKQLRFTPAHPDVRTAEARVASAEAGLKAAEEAVATAAPKDDAPPPPRKVANVEDPYGADPAASAKPKARGDVTAAPADSAPPPQIDPADKVVNLEMEWERLGRALGLARSRQGDLESKLYKAEMVASTAESGYGSTMAVLDPAYKPSGPSNAPNKTVVMIGLAASVVVGLVLSAAWGLFLDDRVFSPNEIETIVMVPVIGFVPKNKQRRAKKKGGKPTSSAATEKGLGASRV